jgi:hypothetical protein
VVTRLMAMKSKYTFSNNCYNDIVKLIIDISPPNHNMTKDLYHCKKLVAGLGMNYQQAVWFASPSHEESSDPTAEANHGVWFASRSHSS